MPEQTRSLGDIFKDNLDSLLNAAIIDRFSESGSEQPEGVTEFANPNTVSQPVRQSQLPSGESLNGFAARLGISPAVLLAGGGALIALAFFLVVRR